MINQVRKWLLLKGDSQAGHIGKIRLAKLTMMMLLSKEHFLARARQFFIFLCKVRNWPSENCSGYFLWRYSNRVLPSNPGLPWRYSHNSDQTYSKGSLRVLQVWGFFGFPGSCWVFRYLRAVFSSIPDFDAAIANVFSVLMSMYNLLNCLSVTIQVLLLIDSLG